MLGLSLSLSGGMMDRSGFRSGIGHGAHLSGQGCGWWLAAGGGLGVFDSAVRQARRSWRRLRNKYL